MKARFLIPFGIFITLVVFFYFGLRHDPREIPSPLVGHPAPAFQLQRLHNPEQTFSPESMRGQVWLLNVWASWCVSCREEHPVLVGFAQSGRVPIIGLDYKDQRVDALRWLDQLGNPYTLSVSDTVGRVGIDYGVYGVPETYVIDKQGIIRMKHIGVVNEDVLAKKILPLVQSLSQ